MEKIAFLRNKRTGAYSLGSTDDSEIVHNLDPGLYKHKYVQSLMGSYSELYSMSLNKNLIKLDKDPYLSRAREIIKFFDPSTSQLYKDLNVKHFLGALFYGAPGSGKTCFVETVVDTLISKYNSIAIFLDSGFNLMNVYDLIKNLRPDSSQHLTLIADEFDQFGGKTSVTFLQFLDGFLTEDNVCFIATTNRFKSLSDQLTNRKSRFGIVQEMSYAPVEIIERFLSNVIPEKYHERLNIPSLVSKFDEKKVSLDDVKYVALEILKNNTNPDLAIDSLKIKKSEYDDPTEN